MVRRFLRQSFCFVLCMLFFGACERTMPTSADTTTKISIQISWKIGDQTVVPNIDSVRITIQSTAFLSKRVNIFPFSKGTGEIEEVPSGIDIIITVEGLDADDKVLFAGSAACKGILEGEITVPVAAYFIVPQDTLGPVISLLSHQNPDTVNSRIVRIFGQALDSSGISAFMVNDSLVPCSDFFWDFHGFMLQNGRNTIRVKAIDNSYEKNVSTKDIVLYYNPLYVEKTNHAPHFTVSATSLTATLKAGDIYQKALSVIDQDSFNVLTFRISQPFQILLDTSVFFRTQLSDTGTYAVCAYVLDQDSAMDSIAWTVTVVNPAINNTPVFLTRSQELFREVYAGSAYCDTVIASDLDQEEGLVYSISNNGGCAVLIDNLSGIIRWTPGPEEVGTHAITIQVKDDSNAMATLVWTVTVKHPNVLVFSAGNDSVYSINDTIQLNPAISLASGSVLRYEWKIGNTGIWRTVSRPDTVIIAPSTPIDSYTCILRITISTGDMLESRSNIRISLDPPQVSAGKDSVVLRNRVVNLIGHAIDRYGSIIKTEWDIGNTGVFTESADMRASFTMPGSSSVYRCVFRATDDDLNVSSDTVTFRILESAMCFIQPDSGIACSIGVSFSMGSTSEESDERPEHMVTVQSFYIDSFEVTQEKFLNIMGVQPSSAAYDHSKRVESITWFDAALYCNTISKHQGFDTVYQYSGIEGNPGNNCTMLQNLIIRHSAIGFRLPTEAEWECACRAGTSSLYYWGNDQTQATFFATFGGNTIVEPSYTGAKQPNGFGLYDVAGNVAEWCNDWYGPYSAGLANNPIGPSEGSAKVIRGGSWQDNVNELRSSNRSLGMPGWKSSFVGFRTVLQVQ